ncbi:MAG: CBS domain-containing protein [Clostridium sp.]|uniref:CBS domain-containing protein n=1 Tax=Clostridium sp. TaxID=1506 RepID=UPI002FCABB2D
MSKKIMSKNYISFKEDDSVRYVLDSLTANGVNGAPILNNEKRLVGIIVKADVFRFLIEDGHFDTCPIEWVMTKKVITAGEYEDDLEIVKRVRESNIAAIPIIDEDDHVIGMATLESIIDAFLENNYVI